MNNIFRGTGVALITPFKEHGAIDFDTLEKLIEFQINNGVEYLLALGTTSEYPGLSQDEQKAVLEFIVEKCNRRVPVLAGVGGNNTLAVQEKIRKMNFDGIDAILSVTPYYNKPQPGGQFQHFKIIAGESPVPVVLYNVPSRSGVNMTADTILKMANEIPGVIGVKEASGDMNQVMKIIRNKPDDFLVISGEDALTMPMVAAGGDGVISVIANAYPREFSEMVRLTLKADVEKARKYHYLLFQLIDDIFADGNPAGIKAALEEKNICRNILRLPLVSVNDEVKAKIKKSVKEIEDALR